MQSIEKWKRNGYMAIKLSSVKTSNSNSNKRRLVKWVQPTIYLDLLYDQ